MKFGDSRSSLRRNRLIAVGALLAGLYLFFIYVYERQAHHRQESAVVQYAEVVSASLWNFESGAPTAYLALLAAEGNYDRLTITTATGESFVDVHASAAQGLEALLRKLGLIPRVEIRKEIVHGEEVIGHLAAVWNCPVIYVCFYALLVGVLLFEIFWLYERLLAANRGLERRVESRTHQLGKANQNLRDREVNLAITLDSIGDAVIATDREGRVTRVNPVARRLTGWVDEPVIGHPIVEIFQPRDAQTREELDHPVARVLETGERCELDEHSLLRSRDGTERLIAATCAPIRDEENTLLGAVLVFRDVTEESRKDLALRESEERYRSLMDDVLDGSAVGMLILDPSFRVVWGNQALGTYFALDRNELIGMDYLEFLSQRLPGVLEEAQAFAGQVERSLKAGDYIDRYECRVMSGRSREERYLEYQSQPIRYGLYAGGRIEQFYDITERHRVEDERREIEAQMQNSQKLESLGVLAGGIAHDFNNLLLGIMGNADLVLMDLTEQHPSREALEEIVSISERAADLCRQMLAYSGRGKFIIKAIDLTELVKDMGHLLEISISKRATLQYECETNLPAVEVDVMQARQVLMNLITNASDAIGEVEGRIILRTGVSDRTADQFSDAIEGHDLPAGRYVYFEVEDNGTGMDEETRARIFDPFFSSKATGRGLGLAAVSGIVRSHHGAVEVKTQQGQGTTIRVLFPAVETPPERLLKRPETGELPRGEGGILLVDDEESVRRLGRSMLERAGYSVFDASDGRDGIEVFRHHHEDIRAVILDMTMPVMSGEEAYSELRKIDTDIPVILSSGFSEQEAMRQFNGSGPAGFIQKPYRSVELAGLLRRVLEEKPPG